MPDPELLAGASVQKVEVAPDLVVLRVRAPGETYFVVVAAGKTGALVGVTRARPFKGGALFTAPAGEKQRWRSRIEGARVVAIEPARILLVREGAVFAIETAAARGTRVVLGAVGEGERGGPGEGAARASEVDAWCARGEEVVRSFGEGALAARRQDVARALAKTITKIERRIQAIAGDLARIGEANRLAAEASAFVAEASRAPRGATSLAVTDWSTGDPRQVEMKLDPAKTAREQVDAMFRRARRLKLGAVIAKQRLAEAESTAGRIAALASAVPEAAGLDDLDVIAKAARIAAPRDFALASGATAGPSVRGATKAAPRKPHRTYRGAEGSKILVGRGGADNDALTFHGARPHDLWLHAKGRTGAHVIVPLERNRACSPELLVEAAHLAAHFSEAREEGIVEVQYTQRRYVRKPKGAAPGLVVVDREKVLVLRFERDTLARLLAGEEIGVD